MPNYVDDVQGFEKSEEHVEDQNGYYVDPNVQYQEDKIEAVLGHGRDEGREDDPEDRWFENIVSVHSLPDLCHIIALSSASELIVSHRETVDGDMDYFCKW